jgi:hypothetical protein
MEKLKKGGYDSFLFDMKKRQDHPLDMNQTPVPSKKKHMHNFGKTDECTTTPRGHSHDTRESLAEINSVQAFLGGFPKPGPPYGSRRLDIVFPVACRVAA